MRLASALEGAGVVAFVVAGAVGLGGCAGRLAGVVRTQASQDFGCPEAQLEVREGDRSAALRDFTVTGCGRQDRYQAACGMVGGCVAYRPGTAAYAKVEAQPDAAMEPRTDDAKESVEGPRLAGEAGPEGTTEAWVALARAREANGGAPGGDEGGGGAAGAGAGGGMGAGAGGDAGAGAGGGLADGGAADPAEGRETEPSALPGPGTGELSPEVNPGATVAARVSTEERTVTLRNACVRRVVFYVGKAPGEPGGRYMTLGSTNMISPRLRVGDLVWLLDAQQAGLTSVAVTSKTEEIEVADSCAELKAR